MNLHLSHTHKDKYNHVALRCSSVTGVYFEVTAWVYRINYIQSLISECSGTEPLQGHTIQMRLAPYECLLSKWAKTLPAAKSLKHKCRNVIGVATWKTPRPKKQEILDCWVIIMVK